MDVPLIVRRPGGKGAGDRVDAYSWCRDLQYAFMMSNDGNEQKLYHMTADPLQTCNLAGEAGDVVETMKQKLLDDAGGPLPTA
jgi:hypothetical protein